jgi:pimeloyl-ACP methyl ester carboxylesterase
MKRPPREPLVDDDLATVTCPTLVAIGDRDFAGPGDRLAAALPNATLKVLRNVDHFATPASFEFIDAMLEFLDAVPA